MRHIGSFFRELLGELVGEAVLTWVSCAVLVGLALAFIWGWERSPLVTGSVSGAVLAFLGYGGWEAFRPAGRGRRGRLAVAAAGTFSVAMVFILYASSCHCS